MRQITSAKRRQSSSSSTRRALAGRRLYAAAAVGVGATVAVLSGRTTRAATYVWDPAASTTSGSDGTGTWDGGITSDWFNTASSSLSVWGNTFNDTAVFGSGGTAGTVNLATNVSVGTIQFNLSGYTLNGSSAAPVAAVILGGAATINTSGYTDTINAGTLQLAAGTTAFNKIGTGTLLLIGDNSAQLPSYTTLNISGGTLQSTGLYNSTVQLDSGRADGGNPTTYNLNGGTIAFNSNSSLGFASGRTINILAGGGAISDNGFVEGAANGQGSFFPAVNIVSGATLDLVATNNLAFDSGGGVIGGAGGITKYGTGIARLLQTNTYTGVTNVNTGILIVSNLANGLSASSIGASSNASSNLLIGSNFNGITAAQFQYTGGTVAIDRGVTFTNTGDSIFNVANASTVLTLNGQILSNGTGQTAIEGAGTLVIGNTVGTNALGGTAGFYIADGGLVLNGTNVISGTLRVGNNGPSSEFTNTISAFMNVASGVTTDTGSFFMAENNGLNHQETINVLTGASLNVTGGSTFRTGFDNTGNNTDGFSVINVSGGATFAGGNTITLSYTANTQYAEDTTLTIGDGTTANGPGVFVIPYITLGSGTAAITFNNGTLRANGSSSVTLIPAGITTNISSGGMTVDTQTYTNLTIAASLNASTGSTGGFTKLGTGTLTLTGADTYTGTNVISAGFLDVENNLSTGSLTPATPNTVATGAGLILGVGATTGSGTGSFTSANVAAVLADTTFGTGSFLGFNTAGGNFTYGTAITGPLGFIKAGGNVLTLTSTGNTYTGPTNIAGGVLVVGSILPGGQTSGIGASSNASSNLLLGSGAQLAYTGGTTTTDRGAVLATSGVQAFNVSTPGQSLTFGGVIAPSATGGTGGFQVLGGGTLVLTNGADSLGGSGSLDVTDGTLTLATAGQAIPTGRLYVGLSNGVTPVSGAATLNLGTGGSYTVAGLSLGVGQATGTTQTVATLNLTNGTTLTSTANDGIGSSNGQSTSAVTGVGVFNISGGARYIHTASDFRLSEAASTSVLNISGATSGLFVNTGTFYLGDPGTSTVNQNGGTVATVGNLTFGNNTLTTETGASNSGTYNLGNGAGSSATLIIGGSIAKTNSGTTSVFNFNGGTLQANSSASALIASNITANVLAGGATINTSSNTVTLPVPLLAGSGSTGGLTKIGTGSLTLSASNSYAGATTVAAGTLVSGNASALPSGTVLNNAATTNFNGQYLTAAGATPTFTLGGLNASSASVFGFNVTSTSIDGLNISAGATVTSGAQISLNVVGATTLTTGTYTLFSDPNGGLGGFSLSRSVLFANGLAYPVTFAATNTADTVTIGSGSNARLFFTGATDATLSDSGNYTTDIAGANTTSATPTATTDVYFNTSNAVATNLNTNLGTLTAVNAIEFNNGGSAVSISGTGPLTLNALANTLAAGVGIQVDAGAVGPTISANLKLAQSETFVNNSASLTPLTISGNIAGNGSGSSLTLTSNAAGAGIVLSGANTYLGATNVTSGILSVPSVAAGGTASPLGQSSNASSNLVIGTAQLVYTGGTATTDRGFTLGGTTAINVSSAATTLTFNGGSVATGTSGLSKYGPGNLAITGTTANLGTTGNIYVLDGGLTVTSAGANNASTGALYIGTFNGFTPTTSDTNPSLTLAGGGTFQVNNLYVGNSSTGGVIRTDTLNLTGGTTLVQNGNAGIGFYTGTQSTLTAGTGVVNISGGSQLIHTAGDFRLTEQNGSSAVVNITGAGSGLFINSGTLYLGEPGSNSVINQNNGTVATVGNLVFGNNSAVTTGFGGTYNLGSGAGSGAVLIVGASINKTNTGTVSTLNFNGGTLQSNGGSTALIASGITVNDLAGGATINVGVNIATLPAPILAGATGNGGLTLLGTTGGALRMTGASTYTGPTVVTSGGNLRVQGSLLSTGTVVANAGGIVGGNGSVGSVTVAGIIAAGSVSSAVGTFTTAGETWNSSGSYVTKFASNAGTAGTTNDELVMSGLTVNATAATPFTVVANLSSGAVALNAGQSILIAYDSNTSSASAVNPFQAAITAGSLTLSTSSAVTAPSGYTVALTSVADASGSGFDLDVSAVAAPEPTSLLLLAAAGAPLALGRRRRARAV